ncbi:MAG TPA: tetratricopeptide repeat protein, partial [Rhizomicrobium sp.]
MLAKTMLKGVFIADGLPAMAQVLADAIAGESGAPLQTDGLISHLRDKFPARLLATGAGDYARHMSQISLARQSSALGDFPGAEDAYRNALDVESRLFGDDSPAVAQTTLELALQVSNQQRFDEASALFRQAIPAINAMPGAEERTRLASYLALDAANRRDYGNALKYARQATAARRADVEAATTTAPGFGGVAVASAQQEAELAHALRIDAEMAMRLGDYPAAEAAAEEALYIMTGQPGMPLAWRADIVLLMGEINAHLGKVVVAEHDLVQAVEMDR